MDRTLETLIAVLEMDRSNVRERIRIAVADLTEAQDRVNVLAAEDAVLEARVKALI